VSGLALSSVHAISEETERTTVVSENERDPIAQEKERKYENLSLPLSCEIEQGEAQLIHLACSQAPDGRQRRTIELLADQMEHLGYVEHISPETVRTTLKKTS
jgi:hypothetical protein